MADFLSDDSDESLRADEDIAGASAKRRIGPLRRIGCGLALLFWFAFLMTPCVLFYLAVNGEIRLWHTDIPQSHEHPMLLISLVRETADRGLRIETSYLSGFKAGESSICVQTVVTYLLWQSQSGDQNVSYCDCYRRADAESAWELNVSFGGTCDNSN